MQELLKTIPQTGTVSWIGLRPGRQKPMSVVQQVNCTQEVGLENDRFSGPPGANRQITLIQAEHLDAVASILNKPVTPEMLRRNIVVSGINLQSLKDRQFSIGDAVLFGTGNCPPCSRMEENLGPGGYNAMRGHGGITARVDRAGPISIGDQVSVIPEPESVESE